MNRNSTGEHKGTLHVILYHRRNPGEPQPHSAKRKTLRTLHQSNIDEIMRVLPGAGRIF
jgi:hypothetical protein